MDPKISHISKCVVKYDPLNHSFTPTKIEWDLIPTDPVKSKWLYSAIRYLGFFFGPFFRGSDRWRFLGIIGNGGKTLGMGGPLIINPIYTLYHMVLFWVLLEVPATIGCVAPNVVVEKGASHLYL